ncbi:aminopeptidase N, partial [Biomphalaria pfeifferi]
LKMFKASHEGQFGNGERAIKQAVEKVETNVKWMGKNLERISALLSAYAS